MVTSKMAAPATAPSPDDAQTLGRAFSVAHTVPGRLRLKLTPPHQPARLEAGRAALAAAAGVQSVRARAGAWSLVVEYDPRRTTATALLALPLRRSESGTAEAPSLADAAEAETLIAASPARVWESLIRPDHHVGCFPGAVELVSAADEDHMTLAIEVLGKVLTQELTIVERVPEQRLVVALSGSLRAKSVMTLRPDGAGTRLHERVEYTLPGRLLGQLIGRLAARPRLTAEIADHLARVKAAAESSAPTEDLLRS